MNQPFGVQDRWIERTIAAIRGATGVPVGWSDHTVQPAVIERAAHRWNAAAVEFHLDLEGAGVEYEAGHCWLPHEIEPVIERVRLGALADGDGVKRASAAEQHDRAWRADPKDGLRPLKATRANVVAQARKNRTSVSDLQQGS
ncbi:MAG: hypothetical protein MAG453_00385 [Calditrichaeota bacterium]|nr:hypothetical protein [Calditrichota bacterium]